MQKLKNSLLAICTLLFGISASAQDTGSLLWEVSGKGLNKPSYLFGTFHLLCPEELSIAKPALDIIDRCDQVFLELDFDDPQLMAQMQSQMGMKDGQTVDKLLSEQQFMRLDSQFTKMSGIPLKLVAGMKPMMLASMLYPGVLGCNPSSPEGEITKKAAEQKKDVQGLETVARQMEVFDQIPYTVQAELLYDYVTNGDRFARETRDVLDVYKKADLAGMQKIMADPSYGLDKYNDILLVKRNQEWIEKIEKAMKSKPSLFAVGAGHLGGDQGVIALLRKQGYTIKPL